MVDLMGDKAWKALYTFTFIRNPYDRIFSLFHYLRKVDRLPVDWDFAKFVKELGDADRHNKILQYYGLRCSMFDMLADADGRFLVKDIFRFEDRSNALRVLEDRLGIDFCGTHIQSAASGKNYRSAYNEETKKIVKQKYARDLQIFNYEF